MSIPQECRLVNVNMPGSNILNGWVQIVQSDIAQGLTTDDTKKAEGGSD